MTTIPSDTRGITEPDASQPVSKTAIPHAKASLTMNQDNDMRATPGNSDDAIDAEAWWDDADMHHNDPTAIDMELDGSPDVAAEISGVTVHGGLFFCAPLFTEVADQLWQGGCEDNYPLPSYIDHVLSLYPWERYAGVEHLDSFVEVPLHDTDRDFDFSFIDTLARWVNAKRALGKVLVHCQAGLNRSGLVVARALMLGDGMSADEAIELLRRRRSPAVLCNELFEAWLRSHDYVGSDQDQSTDGPAFDKACA